MAVYKTRNRRRAVELIVNWWCEHPEEWDALNYAPGREETHVCRARQWCAVNEATGGELGRLISVRPNSFASIFIYGAACAAMAGKCD